MRSMFGPAVLVLSVAVGCSSTSDTANATPDAAGPTGDGAGPPGSDGGFSAPSGGPVAYFDPLDRSSNVGADVTPGIALSDAVESSLTDDAIESGLTIVTWPELAAVSGAVEHAAKTSTSAERYFVRPSAPLEDRWYAVRLVLPASGLRPSVDAYQTTDGSYVSRFRPGSDPLVARVDLCTKGSTEKLAILSSEALADPVDASIASSLKLTQVGGTPTCTFRGAEGVGSRWLSYTCSGVSRTASTTIELPAGLRAAASSKTVPATTLTFTPWSLLDVGGCVSYRAP